MECVDGRLGVYVVQAGVRGDIVHPTGNEALVSVWWCAEELSVNTWHSSPHSTKTETEAPVSRGDTIPLNTYPRHR